MIDTIGLNHDNVRIPAAEYSSWADQQSHAKKSGFVLRWWGTTVCLPNSGSVTYTYYPYLKGGRLKTEFSLPHLLTGRNVELLFDLPGAIDAANRIMPRPPGVPELDLWAGTLYRLDVCYNFQVGDLVPWYVRALQGLEYDHHKTSPYTSEGVHFLNGRNALKLYSKAQERRDRKDVVGARMAAGMLRAEGELKLAYLQKLTGCKKPSLGDITLPWTFDVIENDLKELKLLGRSIGTAVTVFRPLCEKFDPWTAIAMVGLLQLKMDYPSVRLLGQDAHLHPHSIGRHVKNKLEEIDIPPTLTTYSEPLPPLEIDRRLAGPQEGRNDAWD